MGHMKSKRLYWPVTIRLAWKYGAMRSWFKTHDICICLGYSYWVLHLGPVKIIFGETQAKRLNRAFHGGLEAGLSYTGFTREWMLENLNKPKVLEVREGRINRGGVNPKPLTSKPMIFPKGQRPSNH